MSDMSPQEPYSHGCDFEREVEVLRIENTTLKTALAEARAEAEKRGRVVEAARQMQHNGEHFICEVVRRIPSANKCRREGGDMMSKCQTCCNKWQMEDALAALRDDANGQGDA